MNSPRSLRRALPFGFAPLVSFALALALPAPSHAVDEPVVKLLDAGKGKKEPLRIRPVVGGQESISMVLDIGMNITMGDQDMPAQSMPPMTMVMDTTVDEVGPTGDFTYSFIYTDVQVGESEGLPAGTADAMRAAIGGLVGLGGKATMTSRGVLRSGSLTPGEAASPELLQLVQSMEQSLQQLMAPYPQEPVGVGARWEVALALQSNGVTLNQTTVYTLASRQGDVLVVNAEVVQSAPAQTITAGGAEVALKSLSGKGSGSSTLSMGRVTPTTATVDLTANLLMGMDMAGTPMEMSMGTRTKTTLTGSVRK